MSGILLSDLKYQVVKPALVAIRLMTTAGLNLVTGTALAESAAGATGLVQHPSGPALGIFQMEPDTEQSLWNNLLAYNPTTSGSVQSSLAPGPTTPQLVTNMSYAAMMCRLRYWIAPANLPNANDAFGLATYWKTNYNTSGGLGSVNSEHVALFQAAIDA